MTINDLTDEDHHYWCAVEVENGRDIKQRFQLSVTTGMPSLTVDQQKVSAFKGGSVTVMCRYKYPEVTEWCRLGSTCVTEQTGSIDGITVTINASVPNVFIVTMSELRIENSGWYWCADEDSQMPVHITVHELTSTTGTASFTGRLPATIQHSSLCTSAEPYTVQPTNSTLNRTGESRRYEHNISTKATILITTLVLLLLLAPAAFLGWRMARSSKTKPEGSDITAGPQTGNDPDLLYSTIVHNQHVATQNEQNHVPEENVTYSTIVIKASVQQMTEPADGNVIYSTLHNTK